MQQRLRSVSLYGPVPAAWKAWSKADVVVVVSCRTVTRVTSSFHVLSVPIAENRSCSWNKKDYSLPTCTILPSRGLPRSSLALGLRASAAARGSAAFACLLQECSLGRRMREAKCLNCFEPLCRSRLGTSLMKSASNGQQSKEMGFLLELSKRTKCEMLLL